MVGGGQGLASFTRAKDSALQVNWEARRHLPIGERRSLADAK